MLERVAVHQTRLRVPGIGLDARGVALGARGLVLVPSIDRLVAFLALYTETNALGPLIASLRIDVLKSKLGTSELSLSFDAGSSDRMDRIAEVARLAGGFALTGSSRHFVQYRDAAAPFGYDAPEITATDAALALYHNTFSQVYEIEREIKLSSLLLRMMPYADPSRASETGPRFLLAEEGIGGSILSYLVRSHVQAKVALCEWPPESSFDDAPIKRYLFEVPELPNRMLALFRDTPGVRTFLPETPGAAVEVGFRHPIALKACPVFDSKKLVLFCGAGGEPLVIDPLPALGDVRALTKVSLGADTTEPRPAKPIQPKPIQIAVRLAPTLAASSAVEATLVANEDLELFRRLAYALGPSAIATTKVAVTPMGAFVLREGGIDAVPVGRFFQRIHSSIFIPSGTTLLPAVNSDVLYRALGQPQGQLVFFMPDASAVAVEESCFAPLEDVLLAGEQWAPVSGSDLAEALATSTPVVWLDPLGLRPMRRAEPVE